MSRCTALLIALAACSPSSTKPAMPHGTPPTPATAGGDAAPVYGALFENATWTFTGEATTTPPVDMGPQTKAAMPTVTCTSVVDTVGTAKRAVVTCKSGAEGSGLLNMAPAGTFIATDAGLWWTFPEGQGLDAAKLDPREMLIARVAVAHSTEIPDPEMEGSAMRYHAAAGKDGAWCFGFDMAAGDEAGWEMCMTAARGIVSGSVFNAGATTFEVNYTRQ
ncbi:MAG: hypothetical protein NT062_30210 [Proteobacteria bacterium]|nr:hypothetical protein [Pseudomonadota bacterium]